MRKMNKTDCEKKYNIYIYMCVCVCYMAMSQNPGTLATL